MSNFIEKIKDFLTGLSRNTIIGIAAGFFVLFFVFLVILFTPERYSKWTSINFSGLRIFFGVQEKPVEKPKGGVPFVPPPPSPDSEERAAAYLDAAWRDYFRGDYDEALRRLKRARDFSFGNYTVIRLIGQIHFELGKYKLAYTDWMTASMLPNADKFLTRDIEVTKNLIRYTREEQDKLSRRIYYTPGDLISKARERELNLHLRP
ncbi:MAG: hypothetical protein HQM08_10630 [Candidatus Riflebacteria bacterium]|nr:hypothetical protein [Candidatus Riflebacteria bacterium]